MNTQGEGLMSPKLRPDLQGSSCRPQKYPQFNSVMCVLAIQSRSTIVNNSKSGLAISSVCFKSALVREQSVEDILNDIVHL